MSNNSVNLPVNVQSCLFDVFRTYAMITKIVLFGSRARGDNTERSDVDIAIFSRDDIFIEKARIIESIENIDTLLKFDVVFITEKTNKDLLYDIETEGVIIMPKKSKAENYKNAVLRLTEAIEEVKNSDTDLMYDGLIKRFEFTTELAWKACREKLIQLGYTDINAPKPVMKEAYANMLIDNENIWINIINDRNSTSHIYDKDEAREVCSRIIDIYALEFKKLSEVF